MTNTRRTSGEASIFKDDNDRWHGWITVGLKTNGALESDQSMVRMHISPGIGRQIRTMDIDSHVMPAPARAAADRMGAALAGPPATSRNYLILRRAVALMEWVELRGLEPLTPTLPAQSRWGGHPFRPTTDSHKTCFSLLVVASAA